MGKQYKQITGLMIVVLGLVVVLSACSSGPIPIASATAPPEIYDDTPPEVTFLAVSPTTSSTSDPATAQATTTVPAVFDLTRTEDNPVTDAQQIIEILEALESIQRAQPVQPGWYLRSSNDLIDLDNPEQIYLLYHVVDEDMNCDLAMNFVLSPNGDRLGFMTRNYGVPIHSSAGGTIVRLAGAPESYLCNLSDSSLAFFSDDSYNFSIAIENWLEPGAEKYGDYSFSAWFDKEGDRYLFILMENTDNIQSAYKTDPDTNDMVAIRSKEEKRTYSIDTGLLIGIQSTEILSNNKTVNHFSLAQIEYFQEMTSLPPLVLTYLEESLLKYDELQVP
jgi:hypothetical protein